MSEHQLNFKSEEAKKTNSESGSNSITTSSEGIALDFAPKVMALKSLQTAADNSPSSNSIKQLQATVNESIDNDLNGVLQLQAKADARTTSLTKPIQKQENNTGLPDNLKSGMENLTGISMDDVKVHRNSNKPSQLQAHAYAQGTDIHLGPGQEKHLPHELGHVVQQKQGRVKPTTKLKGKVNLNDDVHLENEADVMGAKAAEQSIQLSSNENVSTKNLHTKANTVQRKLLIPQEDGTVKKYDNEKHGPEQVAAAIELAGLGQGWEAHLFADEVYQWNHDDQSWEVQGGNVEALEAEVDRSKSDNLLDEAFNAATTGGIIGMTGGSIAGSVLGESLGSYIGLGGLGGSIGSLGGGLLGAAAGAAFGGVSSLNANDFIQTKLSEELWKLGIIAKGIELNLGMSSTTTFLSGGKITLNPKIKSVIKYMEFAGSEIQIHDVDVQIALQWIKDMEVDFKMPSFKSKLNINIVDQETGKLTLKVEGGLEFIDLEIGVNSLDKSLLSVLRSLILGDKETKKQTKEDIISALKAHVKCGSIAAGLTVNTYASEGKRGKDLGKDEFELNLNAENLDLEASANDLNETSGTIGSLDGKIARKGGKKDAASTIHAHGTFENIPSLASALSNLDVDVSGFRAPLSWNHKDGLINRTVAGKIKKLGAGVAAKLTGESSVESTPVASKEERPALTDVVLEIIKANPEINADGLVESIGEGVTKKQVKDCCVFLIKNKKIRVINPGWNTYVRRPKKYKAAETTGEKLDSIGKKKGQLLSSGASTFVQGRGVDINASGRSVGGGVGNTSAALQVSGHIDKEFVSKAYKWIELAQTTFKVI